jgi:8-oxo-dGTP pyrophosphatase MutT (NUDIX family)
VSSPQAQTAPARPVRPRDAASLVLVRRHAGEHQVLLGRRASAHRFMPNVYVFPGGRLDPADAAAPVHADLQPAVAAKLTRRWPQTKARALAVAAVRETREETGLNIGHTLNGDFHADLARLDYVARAITPTASPIRFHARFFLAEVEDDHGTARDSSELRDLRWTRLPDAFELPIADVTEFVLGEVQRRLSGWTPPGVPLFSYRNGAPRIVYER